MTQSDSRAPAGSLWPKLASYAERQWVRCLSLLLLGTVVLGDERRAMQYGRDEERDVAGFVERIGPNRWRVLMPRPHFESKIDVLELVPFG